MLESCHSTWIFDTDRLRFRRVLKGLALDAPAATTAWRAYYGLEIDPISESFVVILNPEGTRLLRSWRHVEHCSAVRRQPDGRTVARRPAERVAGLTPGPSASERSFWSLLVERVVGRARDQKWITWTADRISSVSVTLTAARSQRQQS